MSQENLERIGSMLSDAQTDPSVMYAMLAADIEWDIRGLRLPGPSSYRGHEGVREFFRDWVGAFDEWGFEVTELIDAGDATVAGLHQWGRGKGSGAPAELNLWQVWTIRGDEVVHASHHLNRDDALAAAGLVS